MAHCGMNPTAQLNNLAHFMAGQMHGMQETGNRWQLAIEHRLVHISFFHISLLDFLRTNISSRRYILHLLLYIKCNIGKGR